jgi:DNA-directed RNA polymerase subunit N (RpoN/RPB10)
MASTFIRCPSCGFCTAPYTEFFDKAKDAYYADVVYGKNSKIKDYDPEKLALNPGSTPTLEELLDALNINNRCCRMRMISKMDFDKLYK